MAINGSEVPLLELVKGAHHYGYREVARSLSATPACLLTLQNYPRAFASLSITNAPDIVFDLGEQDIQATRARGSGSFNDLRRALHLDAATSFEDLVAGEGSPTPREKGLAAALRRTYSSVEDVDALVGLLAEPRMHNSFLGITSYLVFALQTQTRTESDPFYTEWFDEEHYSAFGLQWVQNRTLSGMLKEHFDIDSPPGEPGHAGFRL